MSKLDSEISSCYGRSAESPFHIPIAADCADVAVSVVKALQVDEVKAFSTFDAYESMVPNSSSQDTNAQVMSGRVGLVLRCVWFLVCV